MGLRTIAAFVGQWALTVQSAQVRGANIGVLHYPVLTRVVERVAGYLRDASSDDGSMPIVLDLAGAWQRSIERTLGVFHASNYHVVRVTCLSAVALSEEVLACA